MKQIYTGVVEDILDPLKLGRVRVRVFGLHSDDRSLIPTESLPWATVATPATSASMSGIGNSAVGLLPGSWVVLFFQDPDEQYPVIFASFPGIPVDNVNQSAAYEETTLLEPEEAAAFTKTDPTNPVTSGEVQKAVDVTLTGARRASDFASVSDACIALIKSEERFSATAYFDVNSYSIGYGSKKVDGKSVTADQTITEAQASQALKDYVNEVALPEVKKAVKVLITQSMLDALVSVDYNMGGPNFRKTSILSDLNSEKYLQAASNFGLYTSDSNGKVLNGLKVRRRNEAALFLKDGVPDQNGELQKQEKTESAIEYDSTGKIASVNTNKVLASRGFTDPSGVYPLYRNEPDTNRLARHENINRTIVYKKEAARITGVPVAGSTATWDQSPIPYNATYPHNNVYGTKSGHIMEFDDTPLSRRIHLYHAAGTYLEIDDNGTQVNRIVGDSFEILERNGHIFVRGGQNVTVTGAKNLLVGGSMTVEVMGDTVINARGDATLNVSGNLQTSVNGNYQVKVGGIYSVDAAKVYTNSGMSSDVAPAPIAGTPDSPSFSKLNVVTRGEESAMQYENIDDGSSEAYNADRLESGATTKEELSVTPEEQKTEKVAPTAAPVTSADCGDIHTRADFPPSLVLSKYFTIGDLNKNGARKLINQVGLSPADIACNLKMLSLNVLDTVKEIYPNMIITSGFRRPGDATNSAKNSAHYYGEAVDIQLPGFTKSQYLDAAKSIQSKVPYDQLILEYSGSTTTWIHLSYRKNANRSQVFTMHNHKRISEFGELKLIA